jgi:hypothetical protein
VYFRSFNEILACFVCIIKVARFEFQIESLFFYSNQVIGHLCCNSKFLHTSVLTKFTFVKIKSKENFVEFLRFLPEGLDPFKIHRKFKFESVRKFIT